MAGGLITATVATVAGQLAGALDDLFTSDDERAKARLKLETLLIQPQIIQGLTTLKEAGHASVFVAGWRPALGWVSVSGLGWEFILRPILASLLHIVSLTGWQPEACIQAAADLPHLDTAQLMALVTVLLGVAGYRTLEKTQGVARTVLK